MVTEIELFSVSLPQSIYSNTPLYAETTQAIRAEWHTNNWLGGEAEVSDEGLMTFPVPFSLREAQQSASPGVVFYKQAQLTQ